MSNLGPKQQNTTFSGLLQIPGGVTAQQQQVQDGNGNGTGLFLSSSGVNVTTADSFVASINGNSVSGTIARLISDGFGDFISVKDFGAVGDGVTNDTTSIQTAINSISAAGGGNIFFPSGTYKCNITLPVGVNVFGSGKGFGSVESGGIPQIPNYTFEAGGTTLIPAVRSLPVIKMSGTGSSVSWPNCTISNLKITDNYGAIYSGTVGILAELTQNVRITNVVISIMDTGLQISSTGKTSWGYDVSNVSILNCGAYGINLGQSRQDGTPNYFSNVDVRRCTGIGFYATHAQALSWNGGTFADNQHGVSIVCGGQGTNSISFNAVQFETNLSESVSVTGAGPSNVVFFGCHFCDYRCSNGDGTVFPNPYVGSKNILYNSNNLTQLDFISCRFTTTDVCISYSGSGAINFVQPQAYSCITFVSGINSNVISSNQPLSDMYSALTLTNYTGFGNNRLSYKTNDFTTFDNNFYLKPSTNNGANVAGLLTAGVGNFSSWRCYPTNTSDNANYVSMEAGETYSAIYSKATGTGTAQELRLGAGADENNQLRLSPTNELGFFGSTGTTRQTITGSKGGNAALASLLTSLDAMGLIINSTT